VSLKFIYSILFFLPLNVTAADSFYYENNQKKELSFLSSTEVENRPIRLYKNEDDITVGVSDQIIVKAISFNVIQPYLKELNVVLLKKLTNNLFLVKVQNSNSTITIANILAKKRHIQYAQPNFIKTRVKR
jgi:hypothetical protein